jgi:hypothetical protein
MSVTVLPRLKVVTVGIIISVEPSGLLILMSTDAPMLKLLTMNIATVAIITIGISDRILAGILLWKIKLSGEGPFCLGRTKMCCSEIWHSLVISVLWLAIDH